MAGFTDSMLHVLAELARLDAALEVRLEQADGAPAVPDLASGAPEPEERGGGRLGRLTEAFALDAVEADIVLICLAPEVDRRYGDLYGWLQGDPGRRLPTVDLTLDLTCGHLLTKLAARESFSPSSRLFAHRLVTMFDGPGSLLDRPLRLDARVVRYLLDEGGASPGLDDRWLSLARVVTRPDGDDLVGAMQLHRAGEGVLLVPVPEPTAASGTVETFAAGREQSIVQVHGERLDLLPDRELRALLADVGREARLTGALVHLSGAPDDHGLLADWAAGLPGPTVVSGTASALAAWPARGAVRVDLPVDRELARARSRRRLGTLARLVAPRYDWADLILPAAGTDRLRELTDVARFRSKVLDEWGFGASVAAGAGITVLFAGPSGTGKTMAAQVMARGLERDLFVVDLASMVSKYVGETEKNLAAVFDAAAEGDCVLFFDEADALFGKRTAIKDAHDRYANVQTSFLLQRLEEHPGVVVLATNLRKNMDDAFVRRLHAVVDFPVPLVEERRRIWARIWPPAAPLAPDLDLDLLADRVDLSGGHLRNIAMGAAYLAAADGGVITMAHLGRATRREFQQLGKLNSKDDFGSPA